jgi:hypothetical protein
MPPPVNTMKDKGPKKESKGKKKQKSTSAKVKPISPIRAIASSSAKPEGHR